MKYLLPINHLIALLLLCVALPVAQAHMMPAQRGTINIVGDGAFMVLSVPVTTFEGVDDNGDGKLSVAELRAHYAQIEAEIHRRLQLSDDTGPRQLQGLMLSLAPADDAPNSPATQLVMLGRFALAAVERPLRLNVQLFGTDTAGRTLSIQATRNKQTQLLVLSPDRPALSLFPSALSVFGDYVLLGAEHILRGFDHLLFLLVILACGWAWRPVLAALTCFTLGHCITLAASAWGWAQVPPSIVEPAIAVTIIGMAIFDWRTGREGKPAWFWPRLALVFFCALIHGLGLGSTLLALGLDSGHRFTSLAGFNLGIELGQLAVAIAAAAVIGAARALNGNAGFVMVMRTASFAGVLIGSVWFVQRIADLT